MELARQFPQGNVRPINEYLTSDNTIKITAGPDRKSWILNKDLLMERSSYFQKAIENIRPAAEDEDEPEIQELYFEHADPVAFGHVIDWLYTGKPVLCFEQHQVVQSSPNHAIAWCKLFVLAAELDLEELATIAASTYLACLKTGGWTPTARQVAFIYQYTPGGSYLRACAVQVAADYFFACEFTEFEPTLVGMYDEVEFNLELLQSIKWRVANIFNPPN